MEPSRRSEILEVLGRGVQEGWRKEALKMPNPPDAWLRTYDEVSPRMKKTDMAIGVEVIRHLVEYGTDNGMSVKEFARMIVQVAKNGDEEIRL